MSERSCIVTRNSSATGDMIRFCVGPDHMLVPDLRGNLPGRGAWVTTSRAVLEEAIRRKAFARSLKREVRIAPDLPDQVEQLLRKAALAALSLARRGGGVVTGALKVEQTVRAGRAVMVLHAKEAAEDGKRKIAQGIFAAQKQGHAPVTVLNLFSNDELQVAFGGKNVIHVALNNTVAANGFIMKLQRLLAYCGEDETRDYEKTAKAVKETE